MSSDSRVTSSKARTWKQKIRAARLKAGVGIFKVRVEAIKSQVKW